MKAQLFRINGVAICMAMTIVGAQGQPLVVHEWGTFTSLQDEAGRTLGGINTDDEPVPHFCHDLDGLLIVGPGELPPVAYKGVASCHPDVTMRLETPVLYFHPSSGASCPLTASIKVAFRGGWLTQFYPAAETAGFSRSAGLTEATTGTLAWNDLKIGVDLKDRRPPTGFGPRPVPSRPPLYPRATVKARSSCSIEASGIWLVPCKSGAARTQPSWKAALRSGRAYRTTSQ